MPYKPRKPGSKGPGGKSRPGGRPGGRPGSKPGKHNKFRSDDREGGRDASRDRSDSRPPRRDGDDRPPYKRDDRPPRREQGDRPAYQDRGDRPRYQDRGERPNYQNRGDRPNYQNRDNRPPRQDRGDRPRYQDRGDRPNYQDRGERPNYQNRGDRPNYQNRDNRPPRQDRGERPNYQDRGDRPRYQDRGDRPNYQDRGDRPRYQDRGDRPNYQDRGERPRYQDRGDRPPYQNRDNRPPRQDRGDRPGYQGRPDRPNYQDRGARKPYRDDRRPQGGPQRSGPGRSFDAPRRSAPKNQLPEALIYGINPVSVAIQQGRLRKLFLDPDASNPRLQDILEAAEAADVELLPLEEQGWGDALSRDMHQGVAGLLSGKRFLNLEELVIGMEDEKESTILFLDKIQDPHNLGAVLRTAAATGVDAVVLPKSGGCGLTPAVHKASAGMSLIVNIIEDVNFAQALTMLKKHDYWVVGCDSSGGDDATTFEFPKRRVLVMGSEGSGIRRLVRESCDHLVRLPMAEGVESLNISVATGVVLYMAQASALNAADLAKRSNSEAGEEASASVEAVSASLEEVIEDPKPVLEVDPALLNVEVKKPTQKQILPPQDESNATDPPAGD